ncbi:MAG TPA: hypothetical protein VFX40_05945, partial [Gemmatimonadaceae bacterium]|nr:hypothetical protein [Gemmatimonadaceae bacterium]
HWRSPDAELAQIEVGSSASPGTTPLFPARLILPLLDRARAFVGDRDFTRRPAGRPVLPRGQRRNGHGIRPA